MPEVSPQPSLEAQPAQPQAPQGKGISWKKIIVSVAAIAVVAGIIAGGLYWFFVLNEEETTITEPTKVSTSSSKQATPSAKKEKDETADWIDFEGDVIEYPPGDDKIQVALKFPVSYEIGNYEGISMVSSKDLAGVTPSKTGDIQVQMSLYPKNSGQPDALHPPNDGSDSELGGKTAKRFLSESDVVSYIVKNLTSNSYTFIFSCIYLPKPGDNAEETCDLIVSTFKFLD